MNFYRGGNPIVWYSFLAIAGYLLLTRWQGANALLGTGFRGGVSYVRALQGR
jgi:hypothetical protein